MIRDTFRKSSIFVKISIILFLLVAGLSIFVTLGILLSSFIFQINVAEALRSFNALETSDISLLKFLQSMYSVGMFIFPAIVAAWLFGSSVFGYLRINKTPDLSIFLAITMVIVIAPVINVIIQWNENISLPQSWQYVEQWMRQMENNAKKVTDLFLKADTFAVYLSNVVVLALIPAIGEEFLFRGILQKIFYDSSKRIHIAIWLSAFLFSALHLQFYGFFPRMILGALFGYLFFWSGNLWIPITAHFTNNLIAVSVFYFNSDFAQNLDKVGVGENSYIYVIVSIILFSILLFYFYKMNKRVEEKSKY